MQPLTIAEFPPNDLLDEVAEAGIFFSVELRDLPEPVPSAGSEA